MAQKEAAISRNSHLHPQPGYKMPRSWSTNRPVFALLHLQVEPGELVDYCCSDVSKRTIYLNFNYLYLLLCCCSVLSLSIKFENSTKNHLITHPFCKLSIFSLEKRLLLPICQTKAPITEVPSEFSRLSVTAVQSVALLFPNFSE